MENCKGFFDTYAEAFYSRDKIRVIEIGSQDVNGSLRSVCPKQFEYIGVDFCKAKGVDIVLEDPYSLPFENNQADIILSSSCFEHSEMFWLVYLEVMRCLRPDGLFYLNVPSSGNFHRFPVDCWRFYPDSGLALVNWARRSGINAALLESYTQIGGNHQDFVAVFLKDGALGKKFPKRILDKKTDYENGHLLGRDDLLNHAPISQNSKKLKVIENVINGSLRIK